MNQEFWRRLIKEWNIYDYSLSFSDRFCCQYFVFLCSKSSNKTNIVELYLNSQETCDAENQFKDSSGILLQMRINHQNEEFISVKVFLNKGVLIFSQISREKTWFSREFENKPRERERNWNYFSQNAWTDSVSGSCAEESGFYYKVSKSGMSVPGINHI